MCMKEEEEEKEKKNKEEEEKKKKKKNMTILAIYHEALLMTMEIICRTIYLYNKVLKVDL